MAQHEFDPGTITRPDPLLLKYWAITSLLSGPLFVVLFPFWYIRYRTLRFAFDDEGVSVSWGFLWKREVTLTYRRIQDIHVNRNIVHRWMGLAAVEIQTASGSSGAEMKLEGILQPELLRDFLYTKMRGARGLDVRTPADAGGDGVVPASNEDEALSLLKEIRDALRARRDGGAGGVA